MFTLPRTHVSSPFRGGESEKSGRFTTTQRTCCFLGIQANNATVERKRKEKLKHTNGFVFVLVQDGLYLLFIFILFSFLLKCAISIFIYLNIFYPFPFFSWFPLCLCDTSVAEETNKKMNGYNTENRKKLPRFTLVLELYVRARTQRVCL